ncbi:putative mitochondrial chaperone Frataxin [Massarina eburnea CBS 473.64]|uniref:ferroxidase n=1 Tax=Massarina eburnea CBS 473.64 TaxID=1395130 RepID=A0A6A6RLT6_9PLEO|nr:putative mitochondrial chaperone Frataxin [Massarina eburnea CBS 473.64]
MKPVSRISNTVLRRAARGPIRAQALANGVILRTSVAPVFQGRHVSATSSTRCFHSSKSFQGIIPDAENPPPRRSEDIDQPTVPTDISTSEFHERADAYLDELVARLEEKQEETPDLEVEYSAGVLEVKIPSKDYTFVINKQPPNKQIWLSSPISGPKRFDWVVSGESMHQKEGGGSGDWVYLRGGASMTDIIRQELAVELGRDNDAPS